jgi:peptide/nickel transport system substrate-binding protein
MLKAVFIKLPARCAKFVAIIVPENTAMRLTASAATVLLFVLACCGQATAEPAHGISMHGELKYPAGFAHFDYVNADAPKGGKVVLASQGSFDSLNPFIVRGNAISGVREYVYESLLARSYDEPFSLYGLLAESVEAAEDRSWVVFQINPRARFSDGAPVTPDDVIFSHGLLREKGRPFHRSYYGKVAQIEKVGERGVKFSFMGADRELPLILGLMPILPRHLINPDRFEITGFTIPVGSGPYKLTGVEPGTNVTFQRDPNYWGADLPVNRGHYNFDEMRFEFYRDYNSMFEAFKKGLFHVLAEGDPGRWARDYDFPAVRDGRVIKRSFDLGIPSGMTGLALNSRRPIFADIRVRQAMGLLFDFEWMNKNLYHGLYTRTQSYFDGSELAFHGKPADARERELLAPFPGAVRPEVMDGRFTQPVNDGSGRNRDNRRAAIALFQEAGYDQVDGRMIRTGTGEPFTFEMLAVTSAEERLFLTYARQLEAVGITVSIRQIDSAQYVARKNSFDFDVIQNSWPASLSPGNEQNNRWSSEAADGEGSFNYPGVKSPAADAMIAAMLSAKSRADFVSAVRALDRVLISGSYVVPLFRLPQQWMAHWQQLVPPRLSTLYGYRIDTWWVKDPERQAARP